MVEPPLDRVAVRQLLRRSDEHCRGRSASPTGANVGAVGWRWWTRSSESGEERGSERFYPATIQAESVADEYVE